MSRKTVLGIMLSLLLIGMLTLALDIQVAKAELEPMIYIDPPWNSAPMDAYFTINISIANVTNLNSWYSKLYVKPSILETNISMIQEGPFLSQNGAFPTEFGANPDPPFWGIGSHIIGPQSVNGSGTVASITFKVIGEGQFILYFSETKLRDPDLFQITHTSKDGYFITERHPIAFFTYWPTIPRINQTVTFNASDSFDPDGTIVKYDWDFGDATTDTGMIVTHNYTASGAYNVTLKVTDNASLTDTAWHILMVDPPVAMFVFSPTKPLVSQVVTFDASISFDPDGGNITQYSWDFGDGNITTVTHPAITHVYIAKGLYKVTLTVTDDEGATGSTYDFVSVSGEIPVASFTFSPEEPKVGETVTFNASASFDPDGTIIKYEWNFGDGVTESIIDPIITYSYATVGDYTVTLTVTDNDFLEKTATHSITIAKISSSINITASETTIDVGEDTTISGFITPARADVNVTIHYRLSDETTWNTTTDTTNSTGGYSYVWTPEEAGTYWVKASWQGDVNTLGAESSIITVRAGRFPADINGDGIVSINDVVIAALAFGSSVDRPNIMGQPYNPDADLNNDGKVNIFDLVIIAVNFGKTW